MNGPGYTTTFRVPQSPREVFEAITDVPSWWSGDVVGETRALGGEFTYTVQGVHFSRQKITESVPGERLTWYVIDSELSYLADKKEWTGTFVHFDLSRIGSETEVRFTHEGLLPAVECFEACSSAWAMLINGNLRKRIVSGQAQPNVFAKSA